MSTTACWHAAIDPSAVLSRVEHNLVAKGALVELRQFYGLSAKEMDVLLWREVHEPLPTGCSHASDDEVGSFQHQQG